MNFIYKIKNFQRVMEERDRLKKNFEKYKNETDVQISKLSEERFNQLQEISSLKYSLSSQKKLEKELKQAYGAKGGLIRENNKLVKKINESNAKIKLLEEQLSEYKDKKWLVRELTPEKARTQKIQPARIVRKSVTKYMAEKHDY
jgi:chromosome segregation ATPase